MLKPVKKIPSFVQMNLFKVGTFVQKLNPVNNKLYVQVQSILKIKFAHLLHLNAPSMKLSFWEETKPTNLQKTIKLNNMKFKK